MNRKSRCPTQCNILVDDRAPVRNSGVKTTNRVGQIHTTTLPVGKAERLGAEHPAIGQVFIVHAVLPRVKRRMHANPRLAAPNTRPQNQSVSTSRLSELSSPLISQRRNCCGLRSKKSVSPPPK